MVEESNDSTSIVFFVKLLCLRIQHLRIQYNSSLSKIQQIVACVFDITENLIQKKKL